VSAATDRGRAAAVSALFFASGATGLAYEVVWLKRFGHVWGSSSLAIAAVVAAFLGGLGLGAWLFGRVSDRVRRPLAVYGACEIAIGALAIAVPYAIDALVALSRPLYGALSSQPCLLALARTAATALVLAPPCALMGGTLPLLVREMSSTRVSAGAATAWLYALNAVGAAAGAWIAGFHLLPALGLARTGGLAAASSIAVGVAAIALARRAPSALAVADEPPPAERAREAAGFGRIAAASALSGFAAIALQIVWARKLALVVGGTTYAYSAGLAVFVLGIGLGSLAFRLLWARAARLEPVVAGAVAAALLATLAGAAITPDLALAAGYLQEARASDGFNAVLCACAALALQGVPTFAMGVVFPALVELARRSGARAGRAVGVIYAANTLGSIAGASLTALALLPAIGSFWSTRLALAAYTALVLAVFGGRAISLATSILCGVALLANWREPDPRLENMGLYMYGPSVRDLAVADLEVAYFGEGSSSNVLVLTDVVAPGAPVEPSARFVNVRVNGKIDASNAGDMQMQLAAAYVPRCVRPEARDVLVIGMGSGVTAGASALFDGARVTCCEIEPEMIEAARRFEPWNHGALERERVEIVLDDGRSYLQGSGRGFDLILSEPSNPWIAGVANLFTVEFYQSARRALGRDGVLAQWIQNYAFSPAEYALVARSVRRVFPHVALVRVTRHDTLLLATAGALLPSGATIAEAQRAFDATEPAARDLERYFGSRDVRALVFPRLLLDEKGLDRFLTAVGGDLLNTDLDPRLEFEAPRRLFHERGDPGAETERLWAAAYDPALHRDLFVAWRCGVEDLGLLADVKSFLFANRAAPAGLALVELALAFDPDQPEFEVDRLLFSPDLDQAEFEASARRVLETSALEGYRLGKSLAQLGQQNAARIVLEGLAEQVPTSATVWVELAAAQRALGRTQEAEASLARARELDPLQDALARAPAK
jgi:spermidine synthase